MVNDMVIETNITKLLKIKHPIIAAPMGPFYTNKLTVAVSEAGGLGVLSHVTLHGTVSLTEMKKGMKYVVEHTDKPFGFNIRTATLQPDAIKLCRQIPKFIMTNPKIKEQCRFLITSAGSPKMALNRNFQALKDSSSEIKHFHVVPNLALAEKVISLGVDGIVATGKEGGGHQSYEDISTLVLLQQITTKLLGMPLIASGGFATGQGLASALAMGAGAIAMGSRFIATKECEFHANYKEAVRKSDVSDTKLITGVFGPARVWNNGFAEGESLVNTRSEKKAGETSMDVVNDGLKSLEEMYKGNIEKGTVLLGQSSGLIESIETVADIINEIVNDAEFNLKNAYESLRSKSKQEIVC
jgi:NAD(P)H-dependent flavin oxidoreductase YrpB (nitropropane dioxygenase family)